MQIHLDGFRPGDPRVEAPDKRARPHGAGLPEEADLLIVGCGPAGLTLAAQLARFPEIRTVVVEQKEGPLLLGQADGIACRTMEMFQAFGFADEVLREACWINEVTFWKPNESDPSRIVRHGRVRDVEEGLSEFPHVVLNQARVHDHYLDAMRRAPSRLEPHYRRRFLGLERGEDGWVTARLDHDGVAETIRACYVVGCDGARSVVRQAIGLAMAGDFANQAWGVMDVLAVTDFPDIRTKSAIQSRHGNLLIIPREGGYLVRLYVEMDKLAAAERVAARGITAEQLIAASQRILSPHALDVKEVAWWSVYEIGQRLCPRFDDGEGQEPRVFIAGDACHTHSPKAGQGMNVSMQDAFNLGWKLALVLRGLAAPALLQTYSAERQAVARELIDYDREFARMFSDKAATAGGEGVDPRAFQRYFEQHLRYTAGMGTHYQPSLIRGDDKHQALATGFVIGTRFHSATVVRLCDAKPLELGHAGGADGRWRLYAFAGEGGAAGGIGALCRFLGASPASPVRRFTPRGWDIDAVFDLRAVFQQHHAELAIEAMPPLLLPRKGRLGLTDYEKLFCAEAVGGADIYTRRGIDRAQGALVMVRPDQYIADVLPLDAHERLAAFFDGFMMAPEQRTTA